MSSMSNLRTAQLAIEAEIAHARQGLAYYAERVNSLEQALAGIVNAETSVGKRAPVETAKSRAKNAKRKEKAPGRRARETAAAQVAELPATGGDYWLNLVGSEPKSGSTILADAVHGLGFTPTRAQVGKLRNRMTFALKAMVNGGQIQDSGAGRERRFFRS